MNKPVITNIQRYSIHDGHGIRTTVFFKGCPLSCRWCHNPECQRYAPELLIYPDRCHECGQCAAVCPQHTAKPDMTQCLACGKCVDVCLYDAREIAGKQYTVTELVGILEKDRMFYESSGGGITLSGGEVLAQDMDYITQLMTVLHQKGYSVNIDTCGFVSRDRIAAVLPLTDVFLYDIKLMDSTRHREQTGQENGLILDNLCWLAGEHARIQVRLPLIECVNAEPEDVDEIIAFLRQNHINPTGVNLLPYHDTGSGKYARLGRTYDGDDMKTPSPEHMQALLQRFQNAGFSDCRIGG